MSDTIIIIKADNGWILEYRDPVKNTEIYSAFSQLVDRIAYLANITKVGQTWEEYLMERRGKEPGT
jgi:hypothetical protein